VKCNINTGGLTATRNLNEYNVNKLTRINWRASLVPAAAVIPAPIAYIKVVAVKKFVVECSTGRGASGLGRGNKPRLLARPAPGSRKGPGRCTAMGAFKTPSIYTPASFYFEEIRVFKASGLLFCWFLNIAAWYNETRWERRGSLRVKNAAMSPPFRWSLKFILSHNDE